MGEKQTGQEILKSVNRYAKRLLSARSAPIEIDADRWVLSWAPVYSDLCDARQHKKKKDGYVLEKNHTMCNKRIGVPLTSLSTQTSHRPSTEMILKNDGSR